jgi:hypothetical protein
MKRVLVLLMVTVGAMAGCQPAVSPELLQQYQGRTLYTCCNLHYESGDVSDANYYVGGMLPLGTPVQVQKLDGRSVTILADGKQLTLQQRYGYQQESIQQYADKILVADDPKLRLSSYSQSAQAAIKESRVEIGMTRDQVVMSLGYPPTHRTPTLSGPEWTYWYNTWITYRVQFDGNSGKVIQLIGTQLPSRNQPITDDPPPAKAKAAKKAPPKKKR